MHLLRARIMHTRFSSSVPYWPRNHSARSSSTCLPAVRHSYFLPATCCDKPYRSERLQRAKPTLDARTRIHASMREGSKTSRGNKLGPSVGSVQNASELGSETRSVSRVQPLCTRKKQTTNLASPLPMDAVHLPQPRVFTHESFPIETRSSDRTCPGLPAEFVVQRLQNPPAPGHLFRDKRGNDHAMRIP